jgi:hypothetical protein
MYRNVALNDENFTTGRIIPMQSAAVMVNALRAVHEIPNK